MSLGFALDVTMRGLLSTTSRIQLVSQNITNASKEGYTRKEGSDSYIITNVGTVPVKTNVLGSTDRYLTQSVVSDIGVKGKAEAINDVMDYYSSQLGSTDGTSTMSSYLNDLYGAFQQLAVSPETLANKSEAVQVAANLADSLRNLSGDIQDQRLQADQKIGDTVNSVNDLLNQIAQINSKIVPGQTADAAVAEFEDQRMDALQKLGNYIDIQYYFDSSSQVHIFTGAGQPMLQSKPSLLSYIPTTTVNSGTTFQPILLNGTNITSQIGSGTLAGNIEVRDKTLVDEQAKIDQFATVLKTQMNTLSNAGASLPPRPSMTGSVRNLTNASPISATGSVRIAIVDNNGKLQNYSDVNLGGITTVGGLITALNAIPNVNASLDANGSLVVASTLANTGVSMNQMNSAVGSPAQSFSSSFGLQDMFTGTGATFLNVSSWLSANANSLPVGTLNSGTITAGNAVITTGDGSNAKAMASVIQSNVPFAAAGNFSSQSNSLTHYIEAIMADGSTRAKLAQSQYDTANSTYSTMKDTLNNKTGVNVDEETTKLLSLQNSYAASAKMIQTIKQCFDDLLAAVGS